MTPPIPPVPSCPLLDAKIVEAMANEIWPLDNLSSDEARDDLRRDVRRGLIAAAAALDRDALAVLIVDAIAGAIDAAGAPTDAQLARAVLAKLGLLPAEHREETG